MPFSPPTGRLDDLHKKANALQREARLLREHSELLLVRSSSLRAVITALITKRSTNRS